MDIPITQTPGFSKNYNVIEAFIESYSDRSKKQLFRKCPLVLTNEKLLQCIKGELNTQEIIEIESKDSYFNQRFILELVACLVIDNPNLTAVFITFNGFYNENCIYDMFKQLLKKGHYSGLEVIQNDDPDNLIKEYLKRTLIAPVVDLVDLGIALNKLSCLKRDNDGNANFMEQGVIAIPLINYIIPGDTRSLKLNSGIVAIKLKTIARQLNCAVVVSRSIYKRVLIFATCKCSRNRL
ncbi:hypothetical protein BdWA1_001237 [Babesia duncani]|uniref:Uncharacterized protein n=1 Tax=Babesia duncani TaxID=323732 RepID=A0AAD9PNU8_9APIC|nr:hypothetical protein BdWA1_001237 [Babesia duncani]